MGGAGQVMKRIPRIKFPQRHPKSSASGLSLSLPPLSSLCSRIEKMVGYKC
ncbi:hypothetical protein CK203_036316 [Vitis vinifera]|uniref:Uncharacterized protein n=1 Tax=Vitis vinifera TaxID=29760 RepID=A0A438HSZ6_VITVI|nr:hypothetical protein CK203_036316 [Vitis vinifera]